MNNEMDEFKRVPDAPLVYAGTQNLIQPGDWVRIRWALQKFKQGIFCYVPGISQWDCRLQYSWWAIRADDGTIASSINYPSPISWKLPRDREFNEVSKRITFVRRRELGDPAPESLLPPPPHSLMFYRGTDIDVRLGDRVQFRSIFTCWRITEATISYIPGISPIDTEFEEGGRDWAYTTDDGNIYAGSGYGPGRIIKTLKFLHRAEGK